MSVTTKRDRAIVRVLRSRVLYESATFDTTVGGPLPRTEAEVTAFIRERTRLYVQSWVLPLLDELAGEGVAHETIHGTKARPR